MPSAEIGNIVGPDVLVVAQKGKAQEVYEIQEHNGYYDIFVARRDSATQDFLYKRTATSLSGAVGYIEKSIELSYPDSQKILVDLSKGDGQKDLFEMTFKGAEISPTKRVARDNAETQKQKSEVAQKNEELLEITSNDRAKTKQPRNNQSQDLIKEEIDNSSISNNSNRSQQIKSETSGEGDSDSLGDRLDNEVAKFFGNGQRSNDILKGQLESYVDEGGSPVLAALGATGLDVLGGAMGFAEGTIRGLIDTRNLGEGIKKGTLAGVKEDAGRLLNILPQGRAARAIGNVFTVTDLAEAAADNDAQGLATAGFPMIPGLGQFPTSKRFKSLRVRGKRKGRPKLSEYAKRELPKRQKEWIEERVKELREKGHSDEYIQQTIRGQISEVGLDLDAKTYNKWIEQALKKR